MYGVLKGLPGVGQYGGHNGGYGNSYLNMSELIEDVVILYNGSENTEKEAYLSLEYQAFDLTINPNRRYI